VVAAGEKGWAAGGGPAVLEATLEAQKALYAADRMPAYSLAQTCALLGRKAEALAYLHAAVENHEMSLVGLRVDPSLVGLRGDAGFAEIAARVGLPARKAEK